MQSNILNIENWSSYNDKIGTHYTYKINDNYIYNMWINNINVIYNDDKIQLINTNIKSSIARYMEQNLNKS